MSKQSISPAFNDLRTEIYTVISLTQDVYGICRYIPLEDRDRPERLSLYYDYMLKEVGRMQAYLEEALDRTFMLESVVNQNLGILPCDVEMMREAAREECRKIERESGVQVVYQGPPDGNEAAHSIAESVLNFV